MKKLLVFIAGFAFLSIQLFSLDINGQFTSDSRVALDDGELVFNQEYGLLTVKNKIDDNFFGMASLSLRYFNNPIGMTSMNNILTSKELTLTSTTGPLELSLEEAYFNFTDFIFPGIDLSVGKQRINWGTADRLNPTDILNPLDFSDPLDFGKKIPSLAILVSYTFPNSDSTIELVFEPYSQIARFNSSMVQKMEQSFLITGLITSVNSDASEVITPDYNIKNSLFGGKVSTSLFDFDLSINFVTRITDMPTVSEIAYTPPAVTSYTLSYFREYEVGFDFSRGWGGLLTWGEMSVFFQGKQTTSISGLGPDQYQTVLKDTPYVKYTVGMSKKFEGGIYFNLQFNHGFFTERGEEGMNRLEDYLLLRLEWSVLNDKLTFGLTALGNVNNLYNAFSYSDFFKYISENYGILGGFDIQYKPSLSMTFKIAILLFDGTETTSVGNMKDQDMATISFAYSF